MKIEIAYVDPARQVLESHDVAEGCCLIDALIQTRFAERNGLPEPETGQIGVFGKIKAMDQVLREGDRIEWYRALLADPKQARRKRAQQTPLRRSAKRG